MNKLLILLLTISFATLTGCEEGPKDCAWACATSGSKEKMVRWERDKEDRVSCTCTVNGVSPDRRDGGQ